MISFFEHPNRPFTNKKITTLKKEHFTSSNKKKILSKSKTKFQFSKSKKKPERKRYDQPNNYQDFDSDDDEIMYGTINKESEDKEENNEKDYDNIELNKFLPGETQKLALNHP